MEIIKEILTELKSKKEDSISFSKKHQDRGNEDLHQYYEGSTWAFDFAISIIKEKTEQS
jgi:hypothetical protein